MKNSIFRKLLSNSLKNYNAFFGTNTGSFDTFNYKINYQIINNSLLENQRTYIVDFDIWCKSTTEVDKLADELESIFNYKSIKQDNAYATFLLENRYNQDEKEIYRRTLTFEVRSYMEE